MIDLASSPSLLAGRDRRRSPETAAASRDGFWQRLDRLANMPVGEALRRLMPGHPTTEPRDFAPTRPLVSRTPTSTPRPARPRPRRTEAPAATSRANDECLLPNWLSSIEIVELEMGEADRRDLFAPVASRTGA